MLWVVRGNYLLYWNAPDTITNEEEKASEATTEDLFKIAMNNDLEKFNAISKINDKLQETKDIDKQETNIKAPNQPIENENKKTETQQTLTSTWKVMQEALKRADARKPQPLQRKSIAIERSPISMDSPEQQPIKKPQTKPVNDKPFDQASPSKKYQHKFRFKLNQSMAKNIEG